MQVRTGHKLDLLSPAELERFYFLFLLLIYLTTEQPLFFLLSTTVSSQEGQAPLHPSCTAHRIYIRLGQAPSHFPFGCARRYMLIEGRAVYCRKAIQLSRNANYPCGEWKAVQFHCHRGSVTFISDVSYPLFCRRPKCSVLQTVLSLLFLQGGKQFLLPAVNAFSRLHFS